MARLIALDVGDARIGVAVSDSTGFLASPYTTLHVAGNRQNQQQIWEAIQRVIEETEAEGLVVGLPISLDGQLHAQAEKVQSFARRLQHHITIPLTFWDERLSTAAVTREMIAHDMTRQRRAEIVDRVAAAYILQGCLDAIGRAV